MKYSTLYGLQYHQWVAFKWFHEVKLLNLFNKNIGKSEFVFLFPTKKHIGITPYLTQTATSVSAQHLLSDSCIVQLSCQVSKILKSNVLTAHVI